MDPFFSAAEMMVVRAPGPVIPQCGHCGCDKAPGCRTPHMPVDGDGEQRALVVAEYPGEQEDEKGHPLVGRMGQYLEEKLARFEFRLREDAWLTNAMICKPRWKDQFGNATTAGHESAVDDCRPNLLKAIRHLRPTKILLLGRSALRSLVGHLWKEDLGAMGRWVGWQIPSQELNAWVCPTYNPAWLLREKHPVLDLMFERHLEAFTRLSGPPWPKGPPRHEDEVELIYDSEEAAARIRKYRAGLVAFDFESPTLKPDAAETYIHTCSVCWEGQETIAFPWHGAVRRAMCELLEDPDVGKVASNLQHEHRWCLRKLGLRVRGWRCDTVLDAHALDPRRGVTGLKFQSFVRLGQPDYSHHITPFLVPKEKGGNSFNRIREVGLPQILKYNGLDSLLEFLVAESQAKEMGVQL